MNNLGMKRPGSVVYVDFDTFGGSGESITLTGLAVTGIEVYKNGAVAQRASDAGFVLLDTDGIDFDSKTGIHGISIDLADNTDAGFWEAGAHYRVVIEGLTVNTQTVRFTAAIFEIGYPSALLNTKIATLASQTSFTLNEGPAEDGALAGLMLAIHDVASKVQVSEVLCASYTGATKTVTLAEAPGFTIAATDNVSVMPTQMLTPTARANLQATYDTTGYADGEAPATQSQADQIIASTSGLANVTSAVHKPASSYVLTTGVQSSGTVADVEALDGTSHQHTDTAGVMDLYYEANIGGGAPSAVEIHCALTGNNDSVGVYGYDWVASAWVQIGTLIGTAASTIVNRGYTMTVDMVGSGADHGKVRFRFYAASGLTSATLYVDQLLFAFNQGGNYYDNASVWYDDSAVSGGSEPGIDGTSGNPTNAEASVRLLLTATGLHRIQVAPGSTYTIAAAMTNTLMFGHGATLALGGQNIDQSHFNDMLVSGVGTAANEMEFHECEIGTASVQKAHFYGCTFMTTTTLTLAGDYHIINCQSGVAGAGAPTFTKTAGQAIDCEFRRWSGGVTFSGIESTDVLTISGELGTVTLNGADGHVEIRGTYKAIVDNRTGSPTLNLDGAIRAADVAAILVDTGTTLDGRIPAALVGGLMDSNIGAINGSVQAAVNLALSAGEIYPGTVDHTGFTATTTEFESDDITTAATDHWKPRYVIFTSGTLKGHAAEITAYAVATGRGHFTVATMPSLPADNVTFIVV